jgi:RNA polymerase sigma-70 factor (ECF subfamily)
MNPSPVSWNLKQYKAPRAAIAQQRLGTGAECGYGSDTPLFRPTSCRMLDPPPEKLTPELVFREYAPRIYHIARRMLGNDADAEDVTQDVLLQVIRKLDTFRGESQLSTWLHRVTVNAALAYRQKRANRQKYETAEVVDDLAEVTGPEGPVHRWNVSPDEPVLAAEQTEVIEKAINALPEPFRDVYVLADVEGLPNAEIGELLGLSVPAVKSRLHRARLRMRDALAPHFEKGVAP